jgi:uncharacterized membrane protein YeaQ/YmgE (transglycosylase-associated protein family)
MEAIMWVIQAPFNLVLWIIVGFVAGAMARRIMNTGNYPFWQDILLGLLGAAFGGWLAGFVAPTVFRTDGLQLVCTNVIVATLGAMVLIWIRRTIFGGGRTKKR